MRAFALLGALAAGAVVELMLLRRIVFHQAEGWGDANEAFVYVVAWATVPFVWSSLLVLAAARWKRSMNRLIWPLPFVALAGPALAYIALAQYGHTTPFFMLIGFGLQCLAALVASILLLMPPNNTVERDGPQAARPSL